MTVDRVEKYRVMHKSGFRHVPPEYQSNPGDPFGMFIIPTKPGQAVLRIICAPTDEEWQHVSVSRGDRCPTWEEMCFVKDLFWGEDACIIQFHPPKSDYVNCHKYCLHLWRWTKGDIPMPPSYLVGPK